MTRLVVAGVAWLAALGLFAALIQWSARPRPTPTPPAVTDLVRALNKMETPSPFAKHEPWIVTRATSARHAMVIDVEADKPEDARKIATELVEPLRAKYEEVLVYVRSIGSPLNAATRRIEWTPGGGFVETSY
jgi:multidrug efflux pump subunit AcrB